MIIVKVVLPLPIRQCFEYFMSDKMCPPVIGSRIVVPFRSKDIIGIIISFYTNTNTKNLNLKYVKSLIDTKSLYTNVLLDLLQWISKNYYCPIGSIFFSILPKLLRNNHIIKNQYIYQWTITKKGQEIDLKNFIKKQKQFKTLMFLKKNNILTSELKKYNLSEFILKKLEEQELCKIKKYSKPSLEYKYICDNEKNFFVNKNILFHINNILIRRKFASWLLTKVNLYTKVKFYLKLIRSVLLKNKQVLILVPYIKDINVISVFLKKFFNISINIIHSELSNIQYLNSWMKIQNGENLIIIGSNKSVFLPFLKLGIIIIFEEHNLNYKNRKTCRYNFRDIGILRAYRENIPIILDSDTPSLKTLHNIFLKKCFYIKIKQDYSLLKFNNDIVDLKKERIKFGLSLTLINEINKNFKERQVLLIFNKFNLFFLILVCNICGYINKCSNCNDYFEVNQYHNMLFCRFCLIKIKKPIFCYNCKNLSLIIKNIRIEEIKNSIQSFFPKKPLFFLLDKKKINENFLNKKSFNFSVTTPFVIFTTEDIVYNYYFPCVKLIGLICIDNYFLSFNFRSIEYFAQFYMNLKKLTKKGKKLLKILVQTSFYNHFNLTELYNNGYFSFVKKILSTRKKFLLPPWSIQSIIYSESLDSKKNIIFLNLFRKILEKKSKEYHGFLWCMSPYPCFFFKNKKKYVHQLLIHCSSRLYFNNLFHECMNIMNFFDIAKKVRCIIDIEPN